MELWKDVNGYEGLYQVSNQGRVKSIRSNKIHKKRLTHDGYVKATLTVNYKSKDFRVHRLVAEHFIPNPESKETVNHIDGNKENNNMDNLEWATRSEQNLHSYKLGLKQRMVGASNPCAKLTDEQVKEIRSLYVKGSKEFGTVALGRRYNVHAGVIEKVVKHISYKHLQ